MNMGILAMVLLFIILITLLNLDYYLTSRKLAHDEHPYTVPYRGALHEIAGFFVGLITNMTMCNRRNRVILAALITIFFTIILIGCETTSTKEKTNPVFTASQEVMQDLETYLQLTLDKYMRNEIDYLQAMAYRRRENEFHNQLNDCVTKNDLPCVKAVSVKVNEGIIRLSE